MCKAMAKPRSLVQSSNNILATSFIVNLASWGELITNSSPTFSMSGIHFRVILGRREFTTSRVFQRSWNNTFGLTVSHPASLIRYQNFSSSPLRSKWTQHALPASFSAPNELVEASSAPKKVHKAFIALGSNLGNKVDWIEKACDEMVARGINIKRTSCLWETEPMYVTDQEKFVNGACEVRGRELMRKASN